MTSAADWAPNPDLVRRRDSVLYSDGFLKERTTYEIMDPRSVGVPASQLVVGKHSGRHAIADRCAHLRFKPTSEELDAIYHRIIAVCDTKKWLSDDEIADIAKSVVRA